MASRPRILFICSRNQWRSPTAEAVCRKDPRLEVRSAGTSEKSARRLTARDLDWADVVLVMEPKHARRIRQQSRKTTSLPPIYSLDIPDEYQRMDPVLVQLLRAASEPFIEELL
jgi:predicted protein tyrosine phosphatase